MLVYIHAGGASLDNGAWGPRRQYFDLAGALNIAAETGQYDGDDMLDIPEKDWPVAEQILIEGSMLYKVKGHHLHWQNVKNPLVAKRLS